MLVNCDLGKIEECRLKGYDIFFPLLPPVPGYNESSMKIMSFKSFEKFHFWFHYEYQKEFVAAARIKNVMALSLEDLPNETF